MYIYIYIYIYIAFDRYVFDFDTTPFVSYATGARVTLHPRGTVPGRQDGITVGLGHEATIIATHNKETRIEKYNQDCSSDNTMEVFTDPDDNPEQLWHYSKEACETLCTQSHILDHCHCLYANVLTHETLRYRHPFCSLYNASDLKQTILEEKCPTQIKARLERNRKCAQLCKPMCSREYYKTTVSQVCL